ncbi:transposase [Xanthomonas arboricola]|uniref:Transposase n=1 Tax=Xanthomonas arboricola TaxID=56448 RepID=A0AAU9IJ41_9XANT|nr:transposase [Xanthomonas arboricola]CAE6843968.1 hypothetical protein XA1314C_39030 [Xanthomonas arboricola]CAE6843995.1 hypothetical protein XA1314C_39030 [Xanthomonas arboricola]
MRKSKVTDDQIVATLKQVGRGGQVKDVCRELNFRRDVLRLEVKYGGTEAADVQRLRELKTEHVKLKRMYAELAVGTML